MVAPKEIVNGLAAIVGQDLIKIWPDIAAEYAVDGMMPKAVIFPKNTKEVSEVVKFANQKNLAIVPRGTGSKMSMGNPPKRLDLVICTSRMNHMIDVDTSNLTITMEAGVKFRDIQARLATEEDRCYLPLEDLTTEADEASCSDRSYSGCFLPIDPSYSNTATIGGVVATNSAGPRRLLYNLPRDMILGVRVVAPNGEIAGAGGKTVKNVSGYDISKLMVGSMGSLGILCEMTFKLLPLPEKMETLLLSFESLSDASDFASRIFDTSLLPAAVEVMNGTTFANFRMEDVPKFRTGAYVVAVALEAFQEAVDRMATEIIDMARALRAKSHARIKYRAHLQFWLAVSDLDHTLAAKFPGLIKAKLNYRISEWKDIFNSSHKTLSQNGIEHAILAHAGSGICLINLLIDQSGNGLTDKVVEAMEQLLERSRGSGGNMIIQSAPTHVKKRLKVWGEVGSDFVVMQRLKEQLDPSSIMSPGRFVGGL
ncbi:MAG: FAD-binding oxidoreductase [Desulfobacteraceae bacterium]|nr:MAG: FAD-binding oxidoreductase [Desulfobacteraceae bacterium]